MFEAFSLLVAGDIYKHATDTLFVKGNMISVYDMVIYTFLCRLIYPEIDPQNNDIGRELWKTYKGYVLGMSNLYLLKVAKCDGVSSASSF